MLEEADQEKVAKVQIYEKTENFNFQWFVFKIQMVFSTQKKKTFNVQQFLFCVGQLPKIPIRPNI